MRLDDFIDDVRAATALPAELLLDAMHKLSGQRIAAALPDLVGM